eukprot:snap_masked-scaffold_39-processed-gene-0.23-mRNA-1 protein AED:1.00 eAED:1.00 QI:0/-1/0/0/-1/1/1/0/297
MSYSERRWFPAEPAAEYKPAFDNAIDYWNGAITGSSSPGLTLGAAFDLSPCGIPQWLPSGTWLPGNIMYIGYTWVDGEKGDYGKTGICAYYAGQPRISRVSLDAADVPDLANQGVLEAAVKHEVAKGYGFATAWSQWGVVGGYGTEDPWYSGWNGRQGYAADGGTGNLWLEYKVKYYYEELRWKKDNYGSELMSGPSLDLSPSGNTVSTFTIASFEDMGYSTDWSYADWSWSKEGDVEPQYSELTSGVFEFPMRQLKSINETRSAGNTNIFVGVLAIALVAAFAALVALVKKNKRVN